MQYIISIVFNSVDNCVDGFDCGDCGFLQVAMDFMSNILTVWEVIDFSDLRFFRFEIFRMFSL